MDADTAAWITQVGANGGSVSVGRQTIVNTFITGLKTDGIWTKLDRLWLLAAENTQSARTDVKGLTLATIQGTPTFTTNKGYSAVDGTSAHYINSQFNPATQGSTYTQNSAHISGWQLTNIATSSGGAICGLTTANFTSGSNLYVTFSDGNLYSRINESPQTASQGAPATTRIGHWLANRSGASASQLYQNGSLHSSPNGSSAALVNAVFTILLIHDAGVALSAGTPNQIALSSFGGSLTATEAANFYSRTNTYLSAVGAH